LGVNVQQGANCTIGVRFAPIATGASSATLTVVGSSASRPLRIGLSGDGASVIASQGSITGVVTGTPKMAFTLTAATHAPSFGTIAVALPNGLSLASATTGLADITVAGSGGAPTPFTANINPSLVAVTIELTTAASSARVAIESPELVASRGLMNTAHFPNQVVDVVINVTDVAGGITSTTLSLPLASVPLHLAPKSP
jgi:hypothetical protein